MNQLFLSSLLCTLLIFAWSRPSQGAWMVSLAAVAAGAIWRGARVGAAPEIPFLLLCWAGGMVAAIFVVSLWNGRATRAAGLRLVRSMITPPLLVTFVLVGLGRLTGLQAVTYDRFLYAFDGSLGFQPGFQAANLLLQVRWLGLIANFTYFQLPLVLTAAYLVLRDSAPDAARRALRLFLLIGAAGYAAYQLFPAVGSPVVLSGAFPFYAPRLEPGQIQPIVAPAGARNCMPSLHTSWILAIWWTMSRRPRWWRAAAAAVLGPMLLCTLGFHYLVDMAVAFPFTLLLYTYTRDRRGLCPATRRRAMVGATALFFGWLLALRFGVAVFLLSPVIGWAAMAATVGYSCRVRRRLAEAPAVADAVALPELAATTRMA